MPVGKFLVCVIFIIISGHLRAVNTSQMRISAAYYEDLGLASSALGTRGAASLETALGFFPLLHGQGMLYKTLSTGTCPFKSLVPRKHSMYVAACTQCIFLLQLLSSRLIRLGIRKLFLSDGKSLFSVSIFIQSLSHSRKFSFVWSFDFSCICRGMQVNMN